MLYLRYAPLGLLALLVLLALLAAVLWGAPGAGAANITVNTTTDELNVDGDCSLREAI